MDPGLWREAWPGLRISGDGRAQASLDFTGVAIYYQGWLWSQPTTFFAQVDDRVPMTLDLTDRGTGQGAENATAVPTTVVTILIAANLTEAAHHIVLSKGDGQREVIVGSFIYSTDNPPASSSSSSSAAPRTSSATPRNSSSSNAPNLKIILPSVLGSAVMSFLVCLILFMLWSRRRRRENIGADGWLVMPKSSSESNPASTSQAPSGAERTNPVRSANPRNLWPWSSGSRTAGSKVTSTNTKKDVPERDFRGVIPVIPADLKEEYPNWRIE